MSASPVMEPEPELSRVPLAPPTVGNGLLGVFERRYLLKLLVQREISARYQGSFLGLLWSYVNPLTQFLIYWGLMSGLLQLHKTIPNFGIHIFAGMVVVHFFVETFGAGTRSIVRNRTIVKKMAMPREMFPVATMLVSLFHVGPQVVILAIAALLSGWVPDPAGAVAFVIAVLMIALLGTASALLFSAANVFFRDFSNVVNILNHLVRFGVPMIYPYSIVQDRFGPAAQYYLWNPLADAVLLMQRAFWVGSTPHPQQTMRTDMPDHIVLIGLGMLGVSIVILALSQLVFSRLENRIPERL
ncbi:MAG: ABC transporter permease [Nocardioidaceae bacterium]